MTHLSGELFKKLAGGLDMVHVPYRGGAPGIADITGGTVPVISLSMAAQLLALHRAGKIRIICVNATARVEVAPDIPTAVESGFPGMVVEVFNGIFVPAGTAETHRRPNCQCHQEDYDRSRVAKGLERRGRRRRGGFRPRQGRAVRDGRARAMDADHQCIGYRKEIAAPRRPICSSESRQSNRKKARNARSPATSRTSRPGRHEVGDRCRLRGVPRRD